jgi:AraC-like DNA-binding protein
MKLNALAHSPINQLNLVSVRVESCMVKAQHQFEMHPVAAERFVYITRGKVCFNLPKGKLWANAWDMVYLPCNTSYHSIWQEESEFMVVDLLLHDSQEQTIHFEDAPSVLFHDTHRIYNSLLVKLAKFSRADEPFDWLERLSLTFKLLYEMARDTNKNELDEQFERIKVAVKYLENNYNERFSVNDLAKMCSFSIATFRRIFIRFKGMSPVEYRNRLRMEKASELLKSGNYTVGEAAEAVGIEDIKYFSKLFKQYTGLNPSFIRKNGL